MNLFEDTGAEFSVCRKHRFALWRIWDKSKPLVMFIGLNPSTANESANDHTIKRVRSIVNYNGFGGFYMMNCFSFISTDPDKLIYEGDNTENNKWLLKISQLCDEIVFAWGVFKIVQLKGRDKELRGMFPNAKALRITKAGCPWHPLLIPKKTKFIDYPANR
jgi:hypothetical protein